MRRREFIALLGGAAMPWPSAVRAQQAAMPVIGMISAGSAETEAYRVTAFRRGLGEAGYVEGRNVAVEYRWAEGRYDLMPEIIADLIRRRVAVIATPGTTAAALAGKAATTSIPIVFGVGADPVKLGLVASLARPGGNVTGVNFFTAELVAKRLGLLRELVTRAARVAVLVNPANAANAHATLQSVQTAARAIALPILVLEASTRDEIDAAFATMVREKVDALLVSGDVFFGSRRTQFALLAVRHSIPAIFSNRDYPDVGGLASYGPSFFDVYRQVGAYVGQILNGTRPSDLPVLQSTKFELVINTQTARLLGLDVLPTLLARADVVID